MTAFLLAWELGRDTSRTEHSTAIIILAECEEQQSYNDTPAIAFLLFLILGTGIGIECQGRAYTTSTVLNADQ